MGCYILGIDRRKSEQESDAHIKPVAGLAHERFMVAVFSYIQEQRQVRGPAGQGGDACLNAVEGGLDVFLEFV